MRNLPLVFLLAATASVSACGPGVTAIVDESRPDHFFDHPWPTMKAIDEDGHPNLDGFPTANLTLASNLSDGWASALERTAVNFGNNTGAYFRFDAPLDLPDTLPGTADDAVVWIDAETGELSPLDVRFIADPLGDPYYARNTLAVVPTLGHAPRSGSTVVVAVMGNVARPADGWTPSDTVEQALELAGVSGRVGVATEFVVQDATGQLRAMAADVDSRLASEPAVAWQRVSKIRVEQGETESGNVATVYTAFYEQGGSRAVYLEAMEGVEAYEIDLLQPSYPAAVYEGELTTWAYQDLDARPFMRSGIGHIRDVGRDDGWIDFNGSGLQSTPVEEPMRLVAAVPRAADGGPTDASGVLLYDHGTSGHAYNFLQRRNPDDDGEALVREWVGAGWAVIGRDATLYGSRFPLLDEGFSDGSLGFYNIVNLPAFRDNQRQTALDGHVLLRYVQDQGLDRDLPIAVDSARIRRQGHSLGAVTSNLGLAMDPGEYEAAMLTGTGGVFSHYALDTGLLGTSIDEETIGSVFALFRAEVPDDVTTQSILGAAMGVPEPAWDQIDRQHPLLHLFQWTMDPSDPMAVAADEDLPIYVLISPGDRQTPDFTAEALSERMPDATVDRCEAKSDYDPHSCLWREVEGPEFVKGWLAD